MYGKSSFESDCVRERREHVARARPPDPEARPRRGHVADLDRPVVGQMAADPLAVVVAEGGAGDDREQLLAQARDGEVALDAAARIEHLRVGDPPGVARDAVVAQPLEQLRGARPGHLQLGERATRRRSPRASRHATCSAPIAGDQCLPAQPRGRSDSSPRAAFDSYQFTRSQPDFSPKAASCSRCQPYAGEVRSGRPAWRSSNGVVDVVVGLVGLEHPLERVRGRAVLGAEAAHVHLPEVHATARPPAIHSAITLPTPPAPARPCAQKPAGHEQAADLRLAEAELVVRREALGAVDHARDLHVLHLRHAPARVHDDLLEAVPVVLEQAAVEVGRDAVEVAPVARREGRRRRALVAAHHEAAALLAEVDQQVGVAQRRQRVRAGRARGTAG